MNPLFDPLTGTSEQAISKDVGLQAGFEQNAAAQAEIDNRKRARLAEFAGGGQVSTTAAGAVGAGSAR